MSFSLQSSVKNLSIFIQIFLFHKALATSGNTQELPSEHVKVCREDIFLVDSTLAVAANEILTTAKNIKQMPDEDRPEILAQIIESRDKEAITYVLEAYRHPIPAKGLDFSHRLREILLKEVQTSPSGRDISRFIFHLQHNEPSRAKGWEFSKDIFEWAQNESEVEYLQEKARSWVLTQYTDSAAFALAESWSTDPGLSSDPDFVIGLYHFFNNTQHELGDVGYNWAMERLEFLSTDKAQTSEIQNRARGLMSSHIPFKFGKEKNVNKVRAGSLARANPSSQVKLERLQNDEEYWGENSCPGFRCLSEDNLRSRRLVFVNGLAYDYTGYPVNTGEVFHIFVIGLNGELYLGRPKVDVFHHSSFFSGDDVLGAGMIKIEKGVVVEINNGSGHYKPTYEQFEKIILWLRDMGASIADSAIKPRSLAR